MEYLKGPNGEVKAGCGTVLGAHAFIKVLWSSLTKAGLVNSNKKKWDFGMPPMGFI